ncbi:MAG TPA: mycofactocin biosynthesis chaperone MftB [Acidimicrobiales bacterium]|nr:mycofactocin biosynthesis chaperone MftB [Acidimicrobiales bacterium]
MPPPPSPPSETGRRPDGCSGSDPYDGTRPWALAPQVALRPEPFGALAYDFGTRRLSFLKSRTLLTVVESLADHRTGDAACAASGVAIDELPSYRRALGALAESGMIRMRSEP